MMKSCFLLSAALCLGVLNSLAQTNLPDALVEGPFRKVILDADQFIDGAPSDTLKDPMELAIAPDGRVFYAERDGVVKFGNLIQRRL